LSNKVIFTVTIDYDANVTYITSTLLVRGNKITLLLLSSKMTALVFLLSDLKVVFQMFCQLISLSTQSNMMKMMPKILCQLFWNVPVPASPLLVCRIWIQLSYF